ncbi:tissue inhibitor of metalloproteases [Arctopsyche grandis]|uniref:tissue inhibitor of metalloproteases n=1 Tax=Arctopsyche grandis TaxID=121162 RepID=UPI00406D6652
MLPSRWFYMGSVFFAIVCWRFSEACSCMMEHPQTQYCSADFVIVATVRRATLSRDQNDMIYKLKIRKEFKMSEKAKVALKAGMVRSAVHESVCGVELDRNQTYLLTGRIVSLQAQISLCGYVKPWKSVTPRQRKGFRMLYKQGCPCRIQQCMNPTYCKMLKAKHACKWLNPFQSKCHHDHGICLINKEGVCHWAKARRLTECLKEQSLSHDLTPIER